MALRILQLSALFAVVHGFDSNPSFGNTLKTPTINLSLSITDPEDVVAQRGKIAYFHCNPKSSAGSVQVRWQRDNVPLITSERDRRWKLVENGTLEVVAGRGTTGEYSCIARNDVGALVSLPAKLRIASMEKDFSMSPADTTVMESQPLVLHCSIRSTPSSVVQWEYNDLPLPQNNRYVPLPSGSLLILNADSSDSGRYRCKTINTVLNKTKHSTTAVLTVTPSSDFNDEGPMFLNLSVPTNVVKVIGDSTTLYCIAKGWPAPDVRWISENGTLLSTSPLLVFSNTSINHSGIYSCMASNRLGNSTITYHVDVLEGPRFLAKPLSRLYPVAMRVRLECKATGRPQPHVTWYKDGMPMQYDQWIHRQKDGWLVFTTTFSRDSGIYQCVASNSVGKIWTAVQVGIINVSQIPNPPENLRCRPYNETSICLEWSAPQGIPVKAYSVHTFYKANGAEISLPEYVTNMTYQQAEGLNSSTNYTFYVRLYSKTASDSTHRVTCRTGITGDRNLQIEPTKSNSVVLKWFELSSDITCDGFKDLYNVQWRIEGQPFVNSGRTSEHKFEISGLIPGLDYEFRVTSGTRNEDITPWTPFTLSPNSTGDADNGTDVLEPPKYLKGEAISTDAVRLSWKVPADKQVQYYTVCYVQVKGGKKCEDGTIIKSVSNKLQIYNLKPNTKYEFRVRCHDSDGNAGHYSKPKEIQTQADVPSSILDLDYTVLNISTACIHWRRPASTNGGRLLSYVVSYTPDPDWPLERWIQLTVPAKMAAHCECGRHKPDVTAGKNGGDNWDENGGSPTASYILGDLHPDTRYLVLVRAKSDVGIGKPTVPITLATKTSEAPKKEEQSNDDNHHKTIGIVLGTITSLMFIVAFVLCVLARRRCLKRTVDHNHIQAMSSSAGSGAGSRLMDPVSAERSPTVAARYVSNMGVRFESANPKEVELLVRRSRSDDSGDNQGGSAAVANAANGGNNNGVINGKEKDKNKIQDVFNKYEKLNGHLPGDQLHITENPQYADEDHQPNGRPVFVRFEEDSNSNVKSTKLYDMYRLFENNSRKRRPRSGNGSFGSTHIEDSPNVTQMTCLDESLNDSNGGADVVSNKGKTLLFLEPNG